MRPTLSTEASDTELVITLRVPRAPPAVSTSTPATVTQHTAALHFGIPATAFKVMARAGRFPVKRIGRLLFAAYDDVRRAVTEGAAVARRREADPPPPSAPPTDAELLRMVAEAAMYVAASTTRAEMRARKQEVSRRGWELVQRYEVRRDDGTVNPAHDERVYEHGLDLVLAAGILRFGEAARWYEPRLALTAGGGPRNGERGRTTR